MGFLCSPDSATRIANADRCLRPLSEPSWPIRANKPGFPPGGRIGQIDPGVHPGDQFELIGPGVHSGGQFGQICPGARVAPSWQNWADGPWRTPWWWPIQAHWTCVISRGTIGHMSSEVPAGDLPIWTNRP